MFATLTESSLKSLVTFKTIPTLVAESSPKSFGWDEFLGFAFIWRNEKLEVKLCFFWNLNSCTSTLNNYCLFLRLLWSHGGDFFLTNPSLSNNKADKIMWKRLNHANCYTRRIQVCPKKGTNPTILLWGWDWDHQTYEFSGRVWILTVMSTCLFLGLHEAKFVLMVSNCPLVNSEKVGESNHNSTKPPQILHGWIIYLHWVNGVSSGHMKKGKWLGKYFPHGAFGTFIPHPWYTWSPFHDLYLKGKNSQNKAQTSNQNKGPMWVTGTQVHDADSVVVSCLIYESWIYLLLWQPEKHSSPFPLYDMPTKNVVEPLQGGPLPCL